MDYHSRDDKGLCSPSGKAVVLQFTSTRQLAKYIKDMSSSISTDNLQFKMVPIIISEANEMSYETWDNLNTDPLIPLELPDPQVSEPVHTNKCQTTQSDLISQRTEFVFDNLTNALTDDNRESVLPIDIGNFYDISSVPDKVKYKLICVRIPESNVQFPTKYYKDIRCKSGYFKRSCCREWFAKYEFISYSKFKDGLYCLACIIFPDTSGRRPKKLITEPYQNWKDATTDLKNHASCD